MYLLGHLGEKVITGIQKTKQMKKYVNENGKGCFKK